MMQAVTSIPRTLATVLIFQKFAEWAGSNQRRIKQLRFGCVIYYIYANLCVFYGMYQFIKYKVGSRPGYSSQQLGPALSEIGYFCYFNGYSLYDIGVDNIWLQ